MTERRFSEAEVAAIFERATETSQRDAGGTSPIDGMTLAELQNIGREVGIPAESIALAAQSLDRDTPPPARTFLGLPLTAARTVDLGRQVSNEEWERFIVDLRETFNARGTVKTHGSLREWTNGNLQALLEPTATGHRLRLRTVKGEAIGMMISGLGMLGFSSMMLGIAALKGAVGDPGLLAGMGMLGTAGIAMFGSTALRLPRWARTRQRQMDELAARFSTGALKSLHD